MRALPGIRVTTSALASQTMTAADEGSFSWRPGEQEAGGAASLAEVDQHSVRVGEPCGSAKRPDCHLHHQRMLVLFSFTRHGNKYRLTGWRHHRS